MADQLRMEIEGVEAAERQMSTLPLKIQKRVLSKAVRAANAPFVKEAKRNVPTGSKELKKSITQKVKRYQSKGVVVSIAGPRKRSAGPNGRRATRYAHLVEKGTKPHVIRAKAGSHLKISGGGRTHYARFVQHPGAKASMFMHRAARSSKSKSQAAFVAKMAAETAKEIEKA